MDPIARLLVARFRLAVSARPALLREEPWYARYGRELRALAAERSLAPEWVIGAAAQLSPAGRWDDIVARLPRFLDAFLTGAALPPMPTYGANVRRAVRILRGEAGPSGPKVSRFARNLAGDPDVVTVDRWAARAAGLPEAGGARWYRDIESAYRAGARAVGLAPSQFQAVLWIAARDGTIRVRSA